MNSFKTLTLLAAATLALGGCAGITPTREISSGYAIFDIQAGPEVGHARIADAVKRALQANTTQVQITNGLPPSPLPAVAPRFHYEKTPVMRSSGKA